MTSAIKGCPLCGAPMLGRGNEFLHSDRHSVRRDIGLGDNSCFLLGTVILTRQIAAWNELHRAPATWYFEVVEGLPRFNDLGQGEPASLAFINECFDYIREQP